MDFDEKQNEWSTSQKKYLPVNMTSKYKEAKKKAVGKMKEYAVPATAYSAMVAIAEGNIIGEVISSDAWFTKLDREISELLAASKNRQYDVFVAGYEVAVK